MVATGGGSSARQWPMKEYLKEKRKTINQRWQWWWQQEVAVVVVNDLWESQNKNRKQSILMAAARACRWVVVAAFFHCLFIVAALSPTICCFCFSFCWLIVFVIWISDVCCCCCWVVVAVFVMVSWLFLLLPLCLQQYVVAVSLFDGWLLLLFLYPLSAVAAVIATGWLLLLLPLLFDCCCLCSCRFVIVAAVPFPLVDDSFKYRALPVVCCSGCCYVWYRLSSTQWPLRSCTGLGPRGPQQCHSYGLRQWNDRGQNH